MAKLKVWTHPDRAGQWVGGYDWQKKDRFFFLRKKGNKRRIQFESPEAARKMGWKSK